jgi:hypothetical protein
MFEAREIGDVVVGVLKVGAADRSKGENTVQTTEFTGGLRTYVGREGI